jgi:hypothetical protein
MFSLIALYREYRRFQAAHTMAMDTVVKPGLPANDANATGVAKAA